MSEKLPFAHFRLSQQSDMFSEQIVSGFHGDVKALGSSVGKHLFVEWAAVPIRSSGAVVNRTIGYASDPLWSA